MDMAASPRHDAMRREEEDTKSIGDLCVCVRERERERGKFAM